MVDRAVKVTLSANAQGFISAVRQAKTELDGLARSGISARDAIAPITGTMRQAAQDALRLGVAGQAIGRGFASSTAPVRDLATHLQSLAGVDLRPLQSSLSGIGRAMSSGSGSGVADLARLAVAIRDLSTAATGSGMTDLARNLRTIATALRNFSTNSTGALAGLRDITPALRSLGAIASGDLTRGAADIRAIASAIRQLGSMDAAAIQSLIDNIDRIGPALRRLGDAGGGIGNLAGINAEIKALRDQVDALRRAAGGGGGGGGGGAAESGGFLGGMFGGGSLGQMLAYTGGLAAVGTGIKSVVKQTSDYETQILTWGAVTKATNAQTAQASALALQLGADTSIAGASAADAAVAMTELAKGGLSISQSFQAAKGTLQLAAAAGVDASQAAEIQANAIHAFHISASQAGNVADILANTANAANGEITDFAQGLKQSGAVAHNFGLTLLDQQTILAQFAQAGIKGAEGGNILKEELLKVEAPSKAAAGAIKTLGLQIIDSNGNYVSAINLEQQLAAAKKKLGLTAFNTAAAVVFGARAIQGATIMANNGAVGYNTMNKAIFDGAGAAAFSTAKMSGLGGSFANLQNQAETLAVTVGEKLSKGMQTAVNAVSSGMADLSTFISGPGLSKVGAAFASVGDFFKPIVQGAAGLAEKVWPYIKQFGADLVQAWDNIVAATTPVRDAIANLFKTLQSNGFTDRVGSVLRGVGDAAKVGYAVVEADR